MSDILNNSNTIAPIQTVRKCMSAMKLAMSRDLDLPGIVALYGQSGMGKSKAAALTVNSHQAYFVQIASAWTKTHFMEAILKDMGISPNKTLGRMLDQICEELSLSRRPLVIDEADYAVDKNMLDLIRDIYEGSDTSILIIGEEDISNKILKKSKRFHNRILHWARAEPATDEDANELRNFYGKRANVEVSDDLLKHINRFVGGTVRYLCVNLNMVHKEAKRQGKTTFSLEDWGDHALYSGKPQPKGAR